MIRLRLPRKTSGPLSLLCLGAHSDDIEIGCGGTILQLLKAHREISFHWMVFSAAGTRAQEAVRAAELFAGGCEKNFTVLEFRDGYLPYNGGAVKDRFEELKARVNPDLIFTHWHADAHQDHRLIAELTWNTFRNHLILEYEVPKYDGDMGRPNLFMPLDPSVPEQKVDFVLEAFPSQHSKPWFRRETFLALMRIRGMESSADSGYAEAFHARKVVFGASS